MKAFAAAVLATVASAAPEAKPWLGYGLVHPAAVPAVLPGDLTAHASSGELVNLPNGAVVPDTTLSVKAAAADHLAAKSATYAAHGYGLGLGGYGLGLGGYGLGLPLAGGLWKREAEAEPEADAWLGYSGLYGGLGYAGLGGLGYAGLGYAGLPYTAAAAVPLCINGVAPIGHGLCKREAEAEPEADAWLGYSGLYGGLGYAGLGGLGYAGLGYAGYAAPALVAHPNGAVTPPYTPAQQAAAADHFAAKYGKRSADAEAKPFYYGGYGGYGLGLGYGAGYGYGYLG